MMKKNCMAVVFFMAVLMAFLLATSCSSASREESGSGIETDVRHILDTMSTEQKIAQMIMPAIRTWNGEDVTDLSAVPTLAEALRRHQYGGIILFGQNVKNSDQTVRLISDLQSNNAKSGDAASAGIIPYLVAADQEGGSVARLTMGTRGTGSMADGVTKGYYPATLSSKIVAGMLRGELGFDGVVITDALEMDQFDTEPDNGQAFFTGDNGTVEHDLQVAEKAVNAGCDILLIPTDLNREEAVRYYDEYIAGIVKLVEEDVISMKRIDESVCRILSMKARHGILDMDTDGADADQKSKAAAVPPWTIPPSPMR